MVSLYDVTIPMFIRQLKNLDRVMTIGEEHAKRTNVSPSDYIDGQLYHNMAEFTFQVQASCDFAKMAARMVGGIDSPRPDHTEKTFAELHQRVADHIAFFENLKREDMDGKEDREFEWRGTKYTGLSFIIDFAFPNFYFHVVTAYDILRSKGVPLSITDYLGNDPFQLHKEGWDRYKEEEEEEEKEEPK